MAIISLALAGLCEEATGKYMISVWHNLSMTDAWRDESQGILMFWCASSYICMYECSMCSCSYHAFNLCLLSDLDKCVCVCVCVCVGNDEKPLECEPDVAQHQYPLSPRSQIPWDRNKEARLHQEGLWSAKLYRVSISNWQPLDPSCFLCYMHKWKVLMPSNISCGLWMYTAGSWLQYFHVTVI